MKGSGLAFHDLVKGEEGFGKGGGDGGDVGGTRTVRRAPTHKSYSTFQERLQNQSLNTEPERVAAGYLPLPPSPTAPGKDTWRNDLGPATDGEGDQRDGRRELIHGFV